MPYSSFFIKAQGAQKREAPCVFAVCLMVNPALAGTTTVVLFLFVRLL